MRDFSLIFPICGRVFNKNVQNAVGFSKNAYCIQYFVSNFCSNIAHFDHIFNLFLENPIPILK